MSRKPISKPKPKHGKFIVWKCAKGRTEHCWHENAPGYRDRCCWCGTYKP